MLRVPLFFLFLLLLELQEQLHPSSRHAAQIPLLLYPEANLHAVDNSTLTNNDNDNDNDNARGTWQVHKGFLFWQSLRR
jgi:hypothetical protein